MTYAKPQVKVLGDATDVIESCSHKASCSVDGVHSASAAYDLDE